MRYEDINIDDVQNRGSQIIRELDQENEYKTQIINDHVLRPSSIHEGILLKQALMSLKNLPDDNGSLSAVKDLTEKAFKAVQDKYIKSFENALQLDEIQNKKEDMLITDFSEWASSGASIDIPYTRLAAKALNNAHDEYKHYVLYGYFSSLPENAAYSMNKNQYHKLDDFEDLTKHVIKDSFNYPDRINSLVAIDKFVKEAYSYDEKIVDKIENNIRQEIINSDIKLVFELSTKSPDNMFNIQSEDIDFTSHIKLINKGYQHTLDTVPGFNKVNYAKHSMENINKLVETGVFDGDITCLQFLGLGMDEVKRKDENKISFIADIYNSLASPEMKDSLEEAVSKRDNKLFLEDKKLVNTDKNEVSRKKLKLS